MSARIDPFNSHGEMNLMTTNNGADKKLFIVMCVRDFPQGVGDQDTAVQRNR